jgi:two-component system chemotaxis sensor kinase CheA
MALNLFLDELGTALASIDPAHPEAVCPLVDRLRTFAEAHPEVSFEAVLRRLATLAAGQSADAASDLKQALASLSEVGRALDTDSASTGPAEEQFSIPPWIDEPTYQEFLHTAKNSLDELESDALALEAGAPTAIDRVKRRIHTLKGEAGVVGVEDLAAVLHAVEDLLVDRHPLPLPELVDRLLLTRDWAEIAIEAYRALRKPEPRAAEIIRSLGKAAGQTAPSRRPDRRGGTTGRSLPPIPEEPANKIARDEETLALLGEFLGESDEGLANADQTLIDIERDGVDAEKVNSLFRIFHTLKGVAAALDLRQITSLAHTSETMLNLVRQGEIELRGPVLDLVFDATQMMGRMLAELHRAVDFAVDVSPVGGLQTLLDSINSVVAGKAPTASPIAVHPPETRLGEILSLNYQIPAEAVQAALESQKTSHRKLGEELIAQGLVQPKQVAQAIRSQSAGSDAASTGGKLRDTIKVDLGRVDALVEIIGELVIVETMVSNAPDIVALSSPKVRTYLSQLGKITRDLQDVGMRMRMVPVRAVFQKMVRMVRDLSRKSDKQIQLLMSGEGTEMDRSMVEQVADPLVHMIRNSVDHGVEGPAERIAAGKKALGTIRLSAYHMGGSVIIEVGDDGRGLHREAILRKAVAQKLVEEDSKLSDAEVYNLIFVPGFSTAAQVTEISGRGVGMDVVKRNIDQMRGRVAISTVPGQGTTFKIMLPLTLAIIDGMLVACGEERYIIPTLSIIESIQPDASMLVKFAGRGELVNVRGEVLPLMRLDRLLSVRGAKTDPTTGLVVIVETLGRKVGLLVDEVVTQQQVVIKNLGTGMQNIRFVAGAAILADGHVGLILNMEEIGNLTPDGRTIEAKAGLVGTG